MANSDRSRRSSPSYRAAAICTPGLESICADELRALGLRPKPAGPGTLEFVANARQLYSANVWLRTAGRVIVRVATFRATDFQHLQEHGSVVDWARWIPEGHAPRFRITSNESKLYHTKAIAQRLHQISAPPSIGEPEQLFVVRIDRNTVTLSVDSSGEALHKRPWRTEPGSAPLRPTMAAAMVLLAERPADAALIDPFCGSGVIAIEAALLARRRPPGGDRPYAFQGWSDFQPGSWASVKGTMTSDLQSSTIAPIVASDRDAEIVAAAARNAERAGVSADIEFETRVVSHLRGRSGQCAVVTNPPYGRRVGGDELTGLYRRLGAVVRERLPGAGLTVVTAGAELAKAADGALRPVARFRHGGLSVAVYHRPPRPPVAAG